jgi:hypothetical protein
MPARDEYRKKAEACVAQAGLLRNPQERASLLVIAQTYIKLADRIGARHERATAHRSQGEARPGNAR